MHGEIRMRLGGFRGMDRLQRLVFSFYREDPQMDAVLAPLRRCRMRRSWGRIRVDCADAAHLELVSGLLAHLRLPLAALGLGRQIVLRVPGGRERSYPMYLPFHSDQLDQLA